MHWNEETGGNVFIRSAATDQQFASSTNVSQYTNVKARPDAPTKTLETTATTDSITVTAAADQEYRIGENEQWQSAGSNNQVIFSNLQPGTDYTIQYRTQAVNTGIADNKKFASFPASITVTTNYAAPEDLYFTSIVPGQAVASWSKVAGATNYTVTLYKQGQEDAVKEETVTATDNEVQSHPFTIPNHEP